MTQQIDIPRVVIAGTHSGVGKTTIATALMAALTRRGLRVQPFKAGPDFIDPSFHRAACQRASRNLDGWMLSRQTNLEILARACGDADIAIVEGVMGMFDGFDGRSEAGSTAEIAKWLKAPVLLIVDASAMARSAAAVVYGFENFDQQLGVAGVLFNRVAGPGHYEFLHSAMERNCRAASLGYLAVNDAVRFPDRHLGLVMAEEWLTPPLLRELADWIEASVDLPRLIELTRCAPPLYWDSAPESSARTRRVRIGVARDRAFCFYYQDNLDLLTRFGCELIEFSPLNDPDLPSGLGGLYFGGGYPELYAAQLAGNRSMLDAIRRFKQSGAPVYAECGGFMYLTEAIVDLEGVAHQMAGVFPTCARMQPKLAALGYAEIEEHCDALWLRRGERVRGHEFRYSTIDEMPPEVARRYLAGAREEGYQSGSVLGSYVHLHFASCPAFAERFAAACEEKDS